VVVVWSGCGGVALWPALQGGLLVREWITPCSRRLMFCQLGLLTSLPAPPPLLLCSQSPTNLNHEPRPRPSCDQEHGLIRAAGSFASLFFARMAHPHTFGVPFLRAW
jgi:hypothetical protein